MANIPSDQTTSQDLSDDGSATTEELMVPISPADIGSPDDYGDRALQIDESEKGDSNSLVKDDIDNQETSETPASVASFTINSSNTTSDNATNVCTEPTSKSCSNCMLKTYAAQSAGRSQEIREEIIAITELQSNTVTFSMINSPREHLRNFLRKRIGFPRPVGNQNFLNVSFGERKTFLHGSVLKKRYDITELLLFYGANVNINEEGRTIMHRAAEQNDTLLCKIAMSYNAVLTQYNEIGETPI